MSADNRTGIHIPSVFVGHTSGKALASYFTPEVVLIINDELPFNINTQLILPFSILIGLCFIIMVGDLSFFFHFILILDIFVCRLAVRLST